MTARVVSYRAGEKRGWGVLIDGGIVDLARRTAYPTLRAALEAGDLPSALAAAQDQAPELAEGEFTYDIPVPDAEKIICVGVNYPDRNAEYKDGQEAPRYPSLFPRFARSFVGHGAPLIRPKASEQLDYEGEVVLVIGKGGRHIPETEALSHIAGLSISNEGTIRDWLRHAKFNVTQGKNFDRTASIGPWMVPWDGSAIDLRLTTRVNGEVRQDDRTGRMTFGIPFLISYISTFTTLAPGDMIVSGTPTGAGARADPPVWLKPGDVIEVEVERVGTLVNTVADEGSA
jgi:2-keto-4-pentenoate hydratase/2-oxohepta-3-ene-1,7-dioic acid hydratase in catechol pathway